MVPEWPGQPWCSKLERMLTPCVSEGRLIDHARESCSTTHAKKSTACDHLHSIKKQLTTHGVFADSCLSHLLIMAAWHKADSVPLALQNERGMRANEEFIPFCCL